MPGAVPRCDGRLRDLLLLALALSHKATPVTTDQEVPQRDRMVGDLTQRRFDNCSRPPRLTTEFFPPGRGRQAAHTRPIGGADQKRWRVWLKPPLAKASDLVGATEKTRAASPESWRKAPSRTTHCHRPSRFFAHASARRSSTLSSVMGTATPSTTTSSPSSQRLQPVVRITCGLERMLRAFCSSAPVTKWTAPSSHTATSGVTWGRPSVRTLEIQNSSAASRTRRVSSHVVATASGSLNRASSCVVGTITALFRGAQLVESPQGCCH